MILTSLTKLQIIDGKSEIGQPAFTGKSQNAPAYSPSHRLGNLTTWRLGAENPMAFS